MKASLGTLIAVAIMAVTSVASSQPRPAAGGFDGCKDNDFSWDKPERNKPFTFNGNNCGGAIVFKLRFTGCEQRAPNCTPADPGQPRVNKDGQPKENNARASISLYRTGGTKDYCSDQSAAHDFNFDSFNLECIYEYPLPPGAKDFLITIDYDTNDVREDIRWIGSFVYKAKKP
ncbi:hypothetical protein KQ910_07870 [Reyranella sp. MMS21-HV4-11]|uniref:CUB domain-containing protein n=1 Tax=Reyranella humidisoli TaxID=2849149 RepID=A0ABS6IIU8_9HYPH|nr:hypothetical protein [Reyranella sp. MMS21-HV4-11]MBU8873677.1 hypothetical protein [Reyranella sp. MMS21-HV4-11]